MANEVRDPLSALLPAVAGRRDAPLAQPQGTVIVNIANMAAPTAREVRSIVRRLRTTELLTSQQQDFPRQTVRAG